MQKSKLKSLAVLGSLFFVIGISGVMADAKITEADLKTKAADYYIIEDTNGDAPGEVSAKLQNKLTTIEIPETVVIDNQEYTVTEITGLCYPDTADASLKQDAYKCKKNKKTKKIVLPKTIEKIQKGTFTRFTNLNRIEIAKENPDFRVVNGAVLSKNRKTLYGTVTVKKVYCVPKGVRTIAERAFAYSPVERVVLPRTVTKIQARAFYNCKNLCTVKNIKRVKHVGSGAFYGTMLK